MKSCERKACSHPSGTRNQASGTSPVQYEVTRKKSSSSSVRYEESSRQDFVHLVRRHAKGEHVPVCPVRGINQAGIRQSDTKLRERRACLRQSETRNQVGKTSSIWYEVTQNESLSSSVEYQESCERDFVRLLRSRVKGQQVLVQLVRQINQATLPPSSTKSRRESLSMSVRYEESIRPDFVRPVRSHAIGGPFIVPLVRGIKHAGLLPSSTKSRERRACPSPSGMRKLASWTSSIQYEVV